MESGVFEVVEALAEELLDFFGGNLEVMRLDDDGVDLGQEHLGAGGLVEPGAAVAQEATPAGLGLDDALAFEFEVGLGDGVAVDPELLGEGPYAGERFPGAQGAGGGGGFDLVHDLYIDRLPAIELDLDLHACLLLS